MVELVISIQVMSHQLVAADCRRRQRTPSYSVAVTTGAVC